MKRKKQNKRERIKLPNGCWCGKLAVTPKNWEKGGELILDRIWTINYRFYDPTHIDSSGKIIPYPVRIKGMNEHQTVEQRRAATKDLRDDELSALMQGYNPRLKEIITPAEPVGEDVELTEYTPLHLAFKSALETADIAPKTKTDVRNTLTYIIKAAAHAKISNMPICEVRLKHVMLILKAGPKIKEVWNNNQFNVFKKYMGVLFREIKQSGVIDHNPANEIDPRKTVKSEREEIDAEMRRKIDNHLRKKKMMRFRLFLRVFFSLGIREKELLRVTVKDVNIEKQFVWVTIYKGKSYRRVKKTITSASIRYWKLAIRDGGTDDYVFARGLKPGPYFINEGNLNRRWRTQIKNKDTGLGIDRDMYELKHSHTTKVVTLYSEDHAAAINSHTTKKLVQTVYDLDHDQRKHEELKKVKVSFL